MDSLNQTALMNLENRIIIDRDTVVIYATLIYIFAMPIVVLANYSNTIKGFFELVASVSGKFIFSTPSYIYPSPFQIITYVCFLKKWAFFKNFTYVSEKKLYFFYSPIICYMVIC